SRFVSHPGLSSQSAQSFSQPLRQTPWSQYPVSWRAPPAAPAHLILHAPQLSGSPLLASPQQGAPQGHTHLPANRLQNSPLVHSSPHSLQLASVPKSVSQPLVDMSHGGDWSRSLLQSENPSLHWG